ncbi:hypothetical protein GJ496_005676 [Pomphorhynchus laevis]|nr:hypothetical protein GJ496_005676 [Pomphorhynchus laevis]
MSRKIKNPMGLTLPGLDNTSSNNEIEYSEYSAADDINSSPSPEPSPLPSSIMTIEHLQNSISIDQLQQEFSKFQCTDSQKVQMNEFFEMKKAVCLLNNDTIENIRELGHGSCGVVWLSKCKTSDVVMARKMIHLEVKQSSDFSERSYTMD